MNAEGDVAVAGCYLKARHRKSISGNQNPCMPRPAGSNRADLQTSLKALAKRNRIFGPVPTLNEVVSHSAKSEADECPNRIEGGDNEISARVHYKRGGEEKGNYLKLCLMTQKTTDRNKLMILHARVQWRCADGFSWHV